MISLIIWKDLTMNKIAMVPVCRRTRLFIDNCFTTNNQVPKLGGGMVCFESEIEKTEALESLTIKEQENFDKGVHVYASIDAAIYKIWLGCDNLDFSECEQ